MIISLYKWIHVVRNVSDYKICGTCVFHGQIPVKTAHSHACNISDILLQFSPCNCTLNYIEQSQGCCTASFS